MLAEIGKCGQGLDTRVDEGSISQREDVSSCWLGEDRTVLLQNWVVSKEGFSAPICPASSRAEVGGRMELAVDRTLGAGEGQQELTEQLVLIVRKWSSEVKVPAGKASENAGTQTAVDLCSHATSSSASRTEE